jgi:TPR repeat protein
VNKSPNEHETTDPSRGDGTKTGKRETMEGPVGQQRDIWEDGPVAGQSRFEAARLLRTKYGYVELARALLEVAARDDVAAKVELGNAYRYGDWGVCEDLKQSFAWFKEAARAGSARAMVELSYCYDVGWGCKKKVEKAALWTEKAIASGDELAVVTSLGHRSGMDEDKEKAFAAMLNRAEKGDRYAQCDVAAIVRDGGRPGAAATAARWFMQSAEQNHTRAQRLLAEAYEKGIGLPCDLAAAFYWYERAAIQGHVESMHLVCKGYAMKWVQPDALRAYDWMRRAAKAGSISAKDWLAKAPNGVEKLCTQMWLDDCRRSSRWWDRNGFAFDMPGTLGWLEAGAEGGDTWSQYRLGRCYSRGESVQQDDKRAYDLISRSAEQGYDKALLALAYMLLWGRGVEKDEKSALAWAARARKSCKGPYRLRSMCLYAQAGGISTVRSTAAEKHETLANAIDLLMIDAKGGDVQAQGMLGYCYAYGQGVERDDVKAVEWFTRASKEGHAPSQVALGVRLKRGLGVAKDEARAAVWFALAAFSDNADGHFQLGVCYMKGQGIAVDVDAGAGLFRRAMEKGHEIVRRCLVACAAAGLGMPKQEGMALLIHSESEGGKGTLEQVREMGRNPMRVIDECEVFSSVRPLLRYEFDPWWRERSELYRSVMCEHTGGM